MFRNDPEVVIVLLPLKSGANGLNLVEATHVFLCEPVLNVGVELQVCCAPRGSVSGLAGCNRAALHSLPATGTLAAQTRSALAHQRNRFRHVTLHTLST